jgi:chromosomal replication initiation ATPase DnaA
VNRMAIQIIEAVSNETGWTVSDIVGPDRTDSLFRARQAACLIMRRCLRMSYPEIGRAIGGRHHSSVWNAIQRYEPHPMTEHIVASVCETMGLLSIDPQ